MIDKLKKINIKYLIKVLTVFLGLALVVFTSLASLGIDESFTFFTWISNSLIIFGIIVFGLLMGESSGRDKQTEKTDGLYQKNLHAYNVYKKEIEPELIYFSQYISWLSPQELRMKKINFLSSNGVEPNKATLIVDNCNRNDYEALCDHTIKIGDVIIRRLEEYEKDAVKAVMEGYIKLNTYSVSYYLSALSEGNTIGSILEEGKHLDKERTRNRVTNRTIKIVSSLAISLIWGLFTVKDFVGLSNTTACVNLIARITALFTSLLSGWASSIIDVKILAKKIGNKLDVLTMFHNSLLRKLFIPTSEDKLAEKEYNEWLESQSHEVTEVVENGEKSI